MANHDVRTSDTAVGPLALMPEPLAPGTYVTPSIRLARKLGEGGMGSVWVAFHLGLRTEVVVKFISADKVESGEAVARFEREAALAALAKSPHVVQLFDYGISQDGLPYITMELLEGEDLGSRIAREGAIAPAVLAGWLTQACRGLQRAHAKGIVHRDIKPENIFLCTNDGDTLVKVLDFGIAKGVPGVGDVAGTLTSALLGTPCYMSPEQTTGARSIDYRSDLWALGVLVYYALTGARPFNQTSLAGLVASITTLPIAPPSVHNPALSPAIDRWMGTALQREPSARFASAKELAETFAAAVHAGSAAVATLPGEASRAGSTKTAADWVRLATPRAPPRAALGSRARLFWAAGAVATLVSAGAIAIVQRRAQTIGAPAVVFVAPPRDAPRGAPSSPSAFAPAPAGAASVEPVSTAPVLATTPPVMASTGHSPLAANSGAAALVQPSAATRRPGASPSSPPSSAASAPMTPAPVTSASTSASAPASASAPPARPALPLDPMNMPLQ